MGAVDLDFLAWLSWRVARLPEMDPDRRGAGRPLSGNSVQLLQSKKAFTRQTEKSEHGIFNIKDI